MSISILKTWLLLSFTTLLFSSVSFSQVGINTPLPNPSSMLDVFSNNKGLLIPRVQLIGTNDTATIANPVESLLVYNTGIATGINEISPGFHYWDGTEWVPFIASSSGMASSGWLTTGNVGTISSTNFLGTTDNQSLTFRTNNIERTRITTLGVIEPLNTNGSIYLGLNGGDGVGGPFTDEKNILIGFQSGLGGNATNSIAIGSEADASSSYSITIGDFADADGQRSVAIGNNTQSAGEYGIMIGEGTEADATSLKAIAIGHAAKINTGNSTIAIGDESFSRRDYSISIGYKTNSSGEGNIAIGNEANSQDDNSNSIAIGTKTNAGYRGNSNIVLGNETMGGGDNSNSIAIGTSANAGYRGNSNVAIGSRASAGGDNSNSTAIGNGASITYGTSNKIRLGNSAVTVIEGQVAYSAPSDKRFKYNVQEDVPGLEFITKLRPVQYNFDRVKYAAHTGQKGATKNTNIKETGFLAQEVEEAMRKINYDFDALHIPTNKNDTYSLSYSTFVVPLVKAVQEQQKMIDEQRSEINELKKMVKELLSNK